MPLYVVLERLIGFCFILNLSLNMVFIWARNNIDIIERQV